MTWAGWYYTMRGTVFQFYQEGNDISVLSISYQPDKPTGHPGR